MILFTYLKGLFIKITKFDNKLSANQGFRKLIFKHFYQQKRSEISKIGAPSGTVQLDALFADFYKVDTYHTQIGLNYSRSETRWYEG